MRIEKVYGFVFWTPRAYDSKLLFLKKQLFYLVYSV